MIKTDHYGFVGQHRRNDPTYLDFGDSSNRTALYYLKNKQGFTNLAHLVDGGLCKRHREEPYNNPNTFSRDQLIPFVMGLYEADLKVTARAVFWSHAKRFFFCQNTYSLAGTGPKLPDILAPDHVWHLILCAKIRWLYAFGILGYPFLLLQIIWSAKIKTWDEQNQIISQLIIAGKPFIKLYKWLHPNYKKAIYQYWDGWRDQKEIAENIINRLEK